MPGDTEEGVAPPASPGAGAQRTGWGRLRRFSNAVAPFGGGAEDATSSRNGNNRTASVMFSPSPAQASMAFPNGAGPSVAVSKDQQDMAADGIMQAVQKLRAKSMVGLAMAGKGGAAPQLLVKQGSVAAYLHSHNPNPPNRLLFSPDGMRVLRYGNGNDVKLLGAFDAQVAATLVPPTQGPVRYATFSNDSSLIATCTEEARDINFKSHKVYVWDVDHRSLVGTINVGDEPLAFCVLSNDGLKVLSCDDDGQLEMWDVIKGDMICRFDVNHAAKRCSFSADSSFIISCASEDCSVCLVDASGSGRILHTENFEMLTEARNRPNYVISNDGRKVVVYITEQTHFSNLALFDVETRTYIERHACDGGVTHVEFSNDGSIFIASGRDDRLHVWDAQSGVALHTLTGHSTDVMFVKVSDDGRMAVSGDNDGTVFVWDLDRGRASLKLQGHSEPVAYCELSRDNTRAITLDTLGNGYLWFLDVQQTFHVLRDSSDAICCMQYTPDMLSVAVGYRDGRVVLWDVSKPDVRPHWDSNHGSPVQCLTFSHSGSRLGIAMQDGTIVLLDASSGMHFSELTAHSVTVTGLHFSTDDAMVISCGRDGEVHVWPVKAGSQQPLLSMTAITGAEINAAAMSPNGRLVAAVCARGNAHVWLTSTGELQHELLVTDVPCTWVAFSADSKSMACSSADGSTSVFEVATGHKLHTLVGNASSVNVCFFEPSSNPDGSDSNRLTSVCGRQSITWDLATGSRAMTADFICDKQGIFGASTMEGRVFVPHDSAVVYDPYLTAAVYDMLPYEARPGNCYMQRNGTSVLRVGVHNLPAVVYTPPDMTVHLLAPESAGVKCLDFSSNGLLLVTGNVRGELCVWDITHRQPICKWMAHKRSTITCVKFTHDMQAVYSGGEDCKVILWHWRSQSVINTLIGHQTPVTSLEMSLAGNVLASGDKEGFIFIWDAARSAPMQVIQAHINQPVLCCSMSPDGSLVASSGADEHVVILDAQTGEEKVVLDDALDGLGLSIKFSFDGTRVQVSGDKGSVLIWDVAQNCLMFDIQAHDGKVFDCSWSGDSRWLLSVGSDCRGRLWDTSAGSELASAQFDNILTTVDIGGLLRGDLSSDGSRMAGVSTKGQLIVWELAAEMRRGPDGSMLYKWLSSLSLTKAREAYTQLLMSYPLMINTQDSRGWTILMHAAANSNPEITKLIISNVVPGSGMLGLTSAKIANVPGVPSDTSLRKSASTRVLTDPSEAAMAADGAVGHSASIRRAHLLGSAGVGGNSKTVRTGGAGSAMALWTSTSHDAPGGVSFSAQSARIIRGLSKAGALPLQAVRKSIAVARHSVSHLLPSGHSSGAQGTHSPRVDDKKHYGEHHSPGGVTGGSGSKAPGSASTDGTGDNAVDQADSTELGDPNAVKIALRGTAADVVQHMLDAVLQNKVTPGSYRAITDALPVVSGQYPAMCASFLCGLPLRPLGEMEIPSALAGQPMIVCSAPSYTSYKELWVNELQLEEGGKGPMAVMMASMVPLPFAASSGQGSLLNTLVESHVPVETFGSATVKAIIDFKWTKFARNRIYGKSAVYLLFVVLFTIYAILFSDDNPSQSLHQVLETPKGIATIVFSIILFFFGGYYLTLEMIQLSALGPSAYFDSFWNFVDIISYCTTLIICPCNVFRYGLGNSHFVPVLFALETILLWIKIMFFALAIDGLGTFIFMTIEIIKGMRYFLLLLFSLFISFSVAFMILFRNAPDDSDFKDDYANFGSALLNSYQILYGFGDVGNVKGTEWPEIATGLYCIYQFLTVVLLLNMLITLMGDIYQKVRGVKDFIFLQGRAELILEVESTGARANRENLPYLHILTPTPRKNIVVSAEDGGLDDAKMSLVVAAVLERLQAAGAGGGGFSGGPGGMKRLDGGGGLGLDDEPSEGVGLIGPDDDDGGGGGGGGAGFNAAMSLSRAASTRSRFGGESVAAHRLQALGRGSANLEATVKELNNKVDAVLTAIRVGRSPSSKPMAATASSDYAAGSTGPSSAGPNSPMHAAGSVAFGAVIQAEPRTAPQQRQHAQSVSTPGGPMASAFAAAAGAGAGAGPAAASAASADQHKNHVAGSSPRAAMRPSSRPSSATKLELGTGTSAASALARATAAGGRPASSPEALTLDVPGASAGPPGGHPDLRPRNGNSVAEETLTLRSSAGDLPSPQTASRARQHASLSVPGEISIAEQLEQ